MISWHVEGERARKNEEESLNISSLDNILKLYIESDLEIYRREERDLIHKSKLN